jgi:hypothetical protein
MPVDMPALTPEFLANTPAGMPPSGVPYNYADIKANFVNPDSIAPIALAVISIFLAVMVVTVGLRLYSRLKVIKRTGLDDWMALGAGVSTRHVRILRTSTKILRLLALL